MKFLIELERKCFMFRQNFTQWLKWIFKKHTFFTVECQKIPALLGILIGDLDEFSPGGYVTRRSWRCSGLAYSLIKREVAWEASDCNWRVGQTCKLQTNKHIYIPTPDIYIDNSSFINIVRIRYMRVLYNTVLNLS